MKLRDLLLLTAALALAGCKTGSVTDHGGFSHFTGVEDFSTFARSQDEQGNTILLSPQIPAPFPWNELVVSWNADAPASTFLKVEASAVSPAHATKFYQMAVWSPDNQSVPRASVPGQKDADGDVKVDILALERPANAAQIRLTLGGINQTSPALKFLGLSFCNTNAAPPAHPPNRAAWGKIIPAPERSQQSYAGGGGWCSPTSTSVLLSRWAAVAQRPDWDLDVPSVAAGSFDAGKHNTGNWSFNTAFAGSLKGMRAYVTRFDDISELEAWIAAGIPVAISARWDLLQDGRPEDLNGHLTVCRGFTENGDLVINDPWTDLSKESVRHIYHRKNIVRAWATKHNTVYLIYPEGAAVPPDRFGHWVN